MSRFKTKQQFIDEVTKERKLFEELLNSIPEAMKIVEVVDGMSVKDFLAHRTEWGRMMIRWYEEAKSGKSPAVPTEEFKWNQLKELNKAIFDRDKDIPLKKIEQEFRQVHDHLFSLLESMTEAELFEKKYYSFTGTSDLVTYMNSATASHYRSARRHIQKWWKSYEKITR